MTLCPTQTCAVTKAGRNAFHCLLSNFVPFQIKRLSKNSTACWDVTHNQENQASCMCSLPSASEGGIKNARHRTEI
jgi:hypothetical protein